MEFHKAYLLMEIRPWRERNNMATILTDEERKFFEDFLEKHPVLEERDPDLFDDKRDNLAYRHEQSCARMIRALLEGKI